MSSLFAKSAKRKRNEKVDGLSRIEDVVPGSPCWRERESMPKQRPLVVPSKMDSPFAASFTDIGLVEPLVKTCRQLGFRSPTPVQRTLIPFLIANRSSHVLAIAATGTGKTAAYLLPILHHLSMDPYGIYAVIVTPTRELAMQVHQQVMALGAASYSTIQSVLVVGGLDAVSQSVQLDQKRPHFVVATPGRLAALLRGPQPPNLNHVRYLVLDEADRLLASSSSSTTDETETSKHSNGPSTKHIPYTSNCGFERDVAEILLHCRNKQGKRRNDPCQTLLFSATVTASLHALEELASGDNVGTGLPLQKFIIRQDGVKSKQTKTTPLANTETNDSEGDTDKEGDLTTTVGVKIPNGLQQEYVFMPSRVRDAYLLATVRTLLANGGRSEHDAKKERKSSNKQQSKRGKSHQKQSTLLEAAKKEKAIDGDDTESFKAKSAIIFVSTCERAALVSGILEHVGVANVALHSLLSQHRRLAALGKFQSEVVRVMVATDVAARGLDVPHTDLVINSELPRNPVNYVHRVGRTARAGRRGRAVSLVAECDIALVHAAEVASGRELVKCCDVTDDIALTMLGPAAKAARLTKLKLVDIGFDTLVQKMKERKVRDRRDRQQRHRQAVEHMSAASAP